MSLFSAVERFTAFDHSAVMLNTEHCLHSKDRSSGCEACFAICPVSAITPGKPPSLDPEKCESCLACLTVCPMGAYSADDAVVSLLNAVTHLEGSELELLCEKNPQAASGSSEEGVGIRVKGCLAGLGCGAYISLAAFGLEHILVRTDACSDCEWKTLPIQVKEQISQAKQLLEAWGKADILECVSEMDNPVERTLWEAKNPPLSRRDLFRLVTRQGQVAIVRAMEAGAIAGGHKPGLRRMRILKAVEHLTAPDPVSDLQLVSGDFATLAVSEACNACGTCGRACPTAALQFVLDEVTHSFQLNFSPKLCIGCELCSHVCEPEAVTVEHAPTFRQVFGAELALLLRGGETAHCEQCSAIFAAKPGIHLCSVCEFRRQNPFGSKMPPGFKVQPGKNNAEASR